MPIKLAVLLHRGESLYYNWDKSPFYMVENGVKYCY